MNNLEFVEKLKDIANNYETLYVMGCFGAPMDAANKKRYTSNHSYNKRVSRTNMIREASTDTFGFDCVGLIKGVLWEWNGNVNGTYGGAKYASNGVPDISADTMIKRCADLSTDFTNIEVGELVWKTGHVGVYIGNGLAIECSPKWDNCVQITACNTNKIGYNRRDWTKHGKLPYITYVVKRKTITEIAREVIAGEWGYGAARHTALRKAGYDPITVQMKVDEILAETNMIKGDPYPLADFIKDVQKNIGVAVDGIAGPKTLSKTVTLSSKKNATHALVKYVQKRLYALGYIEVGKADGVAGPKFTSAVAHYQMDSGCAVDGEITARNKTWKRLLGMV